jgi:hypothetical protein
MMSTIPTTIADVEREGVPPSYSRYRYDAYYPSYQERRRRGRGCHHHIQGTGMLPTIPATRAKAEGEGVPPSYSRYWYDAYYPSYQSEGRVGLTIDNLETSQVAGEEEILEVTSNGKEAGTEVGLEVFIVAVWGMVLSLAAALQEIPRKRGEKNDIVGLQKAKQRQGVLKEHKKAFLAG